MIQNIEGQPRYRAYVFGFHVEGVRWYAGVGQLDESTPKVQFSVVPIINVKVVLVKKKTKEDKGIYKAPTYMTVMRDNT